MKDERRREEEMNRRRDRDEERRDRDDERHYEKRNIGALHTYEGPF